MASGQRSRSGPYALLLTGQPAVGKTTVIRRVAAQLEMRQLRGFYTEEIREGGERRGFRLRGFQGQERVIAHTAFPKGHRVGKYGVDVAAMDDAAALLAPDTAARAYLVDEIGKMECSRSGLSPRCGCYLAAGRRSWPRSLCTVAVSSPKPSDCRKLFFGK
jgi:nucleoside-triphosphatase